MTEIAQVFEEQLAGFRAGSTSGFVDYLAAVRPAALESEGWPEADYALFGVPRTADSDAKAAGIAVWAGNRGPASGNPVICAEISIHRDEARIHIEQTRCPEKMPSKTGQVDAPQKRAEVLGLVLETRNDLVRGDSANEGTPMTQVLPADPQRATGPCSANDLRATFDSGNAAGNTDNFVVRVQNVAENPCELSEATGINIDLGRKALQPLWDQAKSAVTLQPWESAMTAISYRPHQIFPAHQIITLQLQGGEVLLRPPAGHSGATLAVAESSEISATSWEVLGYGVDRAHWENGSAAVDIASACQNQQLATTTPQPYLASGQDQPSELPYRLLNISTSTCRIDKGRVDGLDQVPPLTIASTAVLKPGTAIDVPAESGAPDLSGTLIIDGAQIQEADPNKRP
ncbi:hypothetical protein GCM10027404_00020 [Arthrobacter tumbae]|uniref:DUF4232 domain-containing protein n=1 Tax=Arthrobacter tumbae TaxID=163874 RepID=UPI0019597057|nr:DUF4232 domain-containing protein [Arthrobacter tumbae]MBM7780555.1 hypothetical protein [Arthrobacter tumbae]